LGRDKIAFLEISTIVWT